MYLLEEIGVLLGVHPVIVGDIILMIAALQLLLIAFTIRNHKEILFPLMWAKMTGRILVLKGGEIITEVLVGPKKQGESFNRKFKEGGEEEYNVGGVRLLPNKVKYVLAHPDKTSTFTIDNVSEKVPSLFTPRSEARKILIRSQELAARERKYWKLQGAGVIGIGLILAVAIAGVIVWDQIKCTNPTVIVQGVQTVIEATTTTLQTPPIQ